MINETLNIFLIKFFHRHPLHSWPVNKIAATTISIAIGRPACGKTPSHQYHADLRDSRIRTFQMQQTSCINDCFAAIVPAACYELDIFIPKYRPVHGDLSGKMCSLWREPIFGYPYYKLIVWTMGQ